MSKSNYLENALLRLIFNGQTVEGLGDDAAVSPIAALYCSLHTADPGEGGDQTSNECSYASYARTAIDRVATISSNADTGSDFAVGNGTIDGQAQSFANGSTKLNVVRVFANLKKNNSPTGNIVAKIYAHSGSYGSSSVPTGAALATSESVDVSTLTGGYAPIEFIFSTGVVLAASTNYVVAFEYSGGDASNYVQLEGLASSGTHGGNRSDLISSSWSATAGDDLNFSVIGSGFVVTGNSVSPADNIDFPTCSAGTETAAYAAYGVGSSGASEILYSGPLTPNISIAVGVPPRVTTDSTVTED